MCLGEDLGGWTDTCKPLITAFPDPSGFYGPTQLLQLVLKQSSFALFSAPRVPTQDLSIIPLIMGFPGGAVVKNPPADAGDSG